MSALDGLSLGVRLPNSGPFTTAQNILDIATLCEREGFDTIWVHDHISWAREKLTHFAAGSIEACRGQDPNFFESIATAAVLGGRLKRARIAIAGLVLPLRDPRILARQVTTIEQLTGSRLLLAFGIGAVTNDFEVMGVRFDRRGRIMNDHLAALRAIFGEQQPVTFESASLSFANGSFFPRPTRLPLWVTGASDAGLERAVRYADGWMTVYAPVPKYAEGIRRLQACCAAAGRDPDSLDTGIETYVCIGATREQAIDIARVSLEHKFKTLEQGLAACIVGRIDDVMEKLDEYRVAGAKHAEIKFICHDVDQMASMVGSLARGATLAVAS